MRSRTASAVPPLRASLLLPQAEILRYIELQFRKDAIYTRTGA
jgi:hypothetical protein